MCKVPALRDLKAQCKSPVKASFENAQDCVGIFFKRGIIDENIINLFISGLFTGQ
jgi:hypothetical protein